MRVATWMALLVGVASMLTGCGDDDSDTASGGAAAGGTTSMGGSGGTAAGGATSMGGSGGTTVVPFELTSTAFGEGEVIPTTHECVNSGSGDDLSPPLSWTAGPDGTLSYAVVMRDTDFNDLVHWVIYDIPSSVNALPQGIPSGYMVTDPAGAKQAELQNVFFGYFGPCSPNSVNTYQWTVHAMGSDLLPGVDMNTTENTIASAIEGSSLAQASLSGES